MKLWHISQTENRGYDRYDSAVVAAETGDDARAITPNGAPFSRESFSDWASSPEHVVAVYLGEAKEGTKAGVICASFNAG